MAEVLNKDTVSTVIPCWLQEQPGAEGSGTSLSSTLAFAALSFVKCEKEIKCE